MTKSHHWSLNLQTDQIINQCSSNSIGFTQLVICGRKEKIEMTKSHNSLINLQTDQTINQCNMNSINRVRRRIKSNQKSINEINKRYHRRPSAGLCHHPENIKHGTYQQLYHIVHTPFWITPCRKIHFTKQNICTQVHRFKYVTTKKKFLQFIFYNKLL